MQLTQEQINIINAAKTGTNIAISAAAGAAKTTTLYYIAENLSELSSNLYIAYNKSVAEEAKNKFSFGTECRTMHSLAYAAIVSGKYKLSPFLNYKHIQPKVTYLDITVKKYLISLVELYCKSAERSLELFLETQKVSLSHSAIVVNYWESLINPANELGITHDVYLKLYQLSEPSLGLVYDVIFFDECQDANPVILDILLHDRSCQYIFVGDQYQAIYQFNNCINAFNYLPSNFEFFQLSKSFRCPNKVVDEVLPLVKITDPKFTMCGTDSENKHIKTTAYLYRTNLFMFNQLNALSSIGQYYNVLGDLKDLFSKLYHVNCLKYNTPIRYPNPALENYKTWKDIFADTETNSEIRLLVNIIINFPNIHTVIKNIKKHIKESSTTTIATIHKAKGMEWDRVILEEYSLPKEFYSGENLEVCLAARPDMINLLYVAMTRAKKELLLSNQVRDIYKNLIGHL